MGRCVVLSRGPFIFSSSLPGVPNPPSVFSDLWLSRLEDDLEELLQDIHDFRLSCTVIVQRWQ